MALVATARARPLLAAGLIALVAAVAGIRPAHAAVVLTVAKSGGQFSTVQAAVNAVPDNSSTAYTISIGAGTYEERVAIPATKLHLTLLGATGNPANVTIDSAIASGSPKPGGGTYGTVGSATVHVFASNFTADYITFSNSFNKATNPTITAHQAVALAMQGDRQVYAHDIFFGHQDTLLGWSSVPATDLRQYVYASTVDGDVDFIFGNTTLVVDRSTISVLNDGFSTSGALAAPATYTTFTYGILITGCTVASTLGSGTVTIGRAWTPYSGAVPQEVVRNTALPAAIHTANPWAGVSGAKWTAGRYFEYANTGAGATINSNRPQLSSTAAASYTAQKYLAGSDGWNPVP